MVVPSEVVVAIIAVRSMPAGHKMAKIGACGLRLGHFRQNGRIFGLKSCSSAFFRSFSPMSRDFGRIETFLRRFSHQSTFLETFFAKDTARDPKIAHFWLQFAYDGPIFREMDRLHT